MKKDYSSLVDLIDSSCNRFSNLIAFENMGCKLSYNKVDELSKAFANYLINNTNLKKGDRIAFQMPNILQYPIVLLGALRAGMVVVNINPLYTAQEMLGQMKDSGAKAIVILENFAYKLEETFNLKELKGQKEVIVTGVGDMFGGVKGKMIDMFLKYFKRMVPRYNLPTAKRFKTVLKEGFKLPYKQQSLSSTDIAFLQYTGGTTGISKGAILTHSNVISNINQFYDWAKSKIREADEIQITPLPLYHIMSLTNTLSMFGIGAKNVLITNPRDLKAFIKELKKHSFTLLTGVNTLFKGLMSKKGFFKVNFSSCKIVMGGGSAIQESVAKKWKEITNTNLVEAYGLTEASPGVIANPVDGNHTLNTVGMPLSNTEIKIINDNGKEVESGIPGELLVRGPQVMQGYWNNVQETKNVFINGWLKTGDIARITENGCVQIVDRKKDMIIVSGFNVFPNEIEEAALRHPKVLEAAAIGIPHHYSGEAVKLFVVTNDSSLCEEEIKQFCRNGLTGYKIPKYVEFRSSLPKSPIGKVLKRILKEEKEAISV